MGHDTDDFVAVFLDEARELIEAFGQVGLRMEREGAQAALLNEAFRVIHTIKGSAMSVGLSALGHAVHEFESELDECRKSDAVGIDSSVINSWLEWTDYLDGFVRGLRQDRDFIPARPRPDSRSLAPVSPRNTAISPPAVFAVASRPESQPNGSPLQSSSEVAGDSAAMHLFYRSYLATASDGAEDSAKDLLALGVLGIPQTRVDQFAPLALEILRHSCGLPQLTRLCFVRRLGLSNEFEVLSAATDRDDGEASHARVTGNRCFVSPRSSIFALQPGMMRVLDFRRAIVDYHDRGRSPQRAIGRLASEGFGSGLCMALSSGRFTIGLLFLNSIDDFCLRFPKGKLPLLASLVLYATRQIQEYCELDPAYFEVFRDRHGDVVGEKFDGTRLQTVCSALSQQLGTSPVRISAAEAKSTAVSSLLSHGNLAFLTALIASHRLVDELEVSVAGDESRTVFECRVSGPASATERLSPLRLKAIARQAQCLGFQMARRGEDGVAFEIPTDPSWEPAALYSV